MIKATVFDIKRRSLTDGPGERTAVFFKGCNLTCRWCHSPESWSPKIELMIYENRCIHCKTCEIVCPFALTDCNLCGKCAVNCMQDARKLCGKTYTADKLLEEIIKDRRSYESSGGGVTFSGGEPMLQIDFLTEILKKCKEAGIHTAVDTAGAVPWESFERILPYTDLFLYDIKAATEDVHKKYTGQSNALILENLAHLSGRAEMIVRVPIIPTVNDSQQELERLAQIIKGARVSKIELLPYSNIGEENFEAIGKSPRSFLIPSAEAIERYKKIFAI